jgi:hypothetical protein
MRWEFSSATWIPGRCCMQRPKKEGDTLAPAASPQQWSSPWPWQLSPVSSSSNTSWEVSPSQMWVPTSQDPSTLCKLLGSYNLHYLPFVHQPWARIASCSYYWLQQNTLLCFPFFWPNPDLNSNSTDPSLCEESILRSKQSWASVAHTYNPSYSGGTDQENCSSVSPGNSLQDPISKIPNTKRAGGVTQGIGPEFKPQYHREKKKSKQ